MTTQPKLLRMLFILCLALLLNAQARAEADGLITMDKQVAGLDNAITKLTAGVIE